MHVFSFGGGVQSTAVLVLAAQGELDVDAFLFANVGDDSEHPATLRYVHEVAMPYAAAHGIALHELRKTRRDGSVETLYGRLMRAGSKSIGIPVRLSGSGAPARRNCTADFKIRVIAAWCYRHGARRTTPATTLLGISLDEFQRMRNDSGIPHTRLGYPLIDRRMSRMDCMNLIVRAGLPVPPKSSCWFCPFHSLRAWQELRDREPSLFARACELETTLTARAKTLVRKNPAYRPEDQAVFMTRRMVPLARAVGEARQPRLFGEVERLGEGEEDACESGFCLL
jgi:hypothetical protein